MRESWRICQLTKEMKHQILNRFGNLQNIFLHCVVVYYTAPSTYDFSTTVANVLPNGIKVAYNTLMPVRFCYTHCFAELQLFKTTVISKFAGEFVGAPVPRTGYDLYFRNQYNRRFRLRSAYEYCICLRRDQKLLFLSGWTAVQSCVSHLVAG